MSRNVQLKIMVSAEEKETLKVSAGREPMGAYCRRILLGTNLSDVESDVASGKGKASVESRQPFFKKPDKLI
jgi:hypothetical protein